MEEVAEEVAAAGAAAGAAGVSCPRFASALEGQLRQTTAQINEASILRLALFVCAALDSLTKFWRQQGGCDGSQEERALVASLRKLLLLIFKPGRISSFLNITCIADLQDHKLAQAVEASKLQQSLLRGVIRCVAAAYGSAFHVSESAVLGTGSPGVGAQTSGGHAKQQTDKHPTTMGIGDESSKVGSTLTGQPQHDSGVGGCTAVGSVHVSHAVLLAWQLLWPCRDVLLELMAAVAHIERYAINDNMIPLSHHRSHESYVKLANTTVLAVLQLKLQHDFAWFGLPAYHHPHACGISPGADTATNDSKVNPIGSQAISNSSNTRNGRNIGGKNSAHRIGRLQAAGLTPPDSDRRHTQGIPISIGMANLWEHEPWLSLLQTPGLLASRWKYLRTQQCQWQHYANTYARSIPPHLLQHQLVRERKLQQLTDTWCRLFAHVTFDAFVQPAQAVQLCGVDPVSHIRSTVLYAGLHTGMRLLVKALCTTHPLSEGARQHMSLVDGILALAKYSCSPRAVMLAVIRPLGIICHCVKAMESGMSVPRNQHIARRALVAFNVLQSNVLACPKHVQWWPATSASTFQISDSSSRSGGPGVAPAEASGSCTPSVADIPVQSVQGPNGSNAADDGLSTNSSSGNAVEGQGRRHTHAHGATGFQLSFPQELLSDANGISCIERMGEPLFQLLDMLKASGIMLHKPVEDGLASAFMQIAVNEGAASQTIPDAAQGPPPPIGVIMQPHMQKLQAFHSGSWQGVGCANCHCTKLAGDSELDLPLFKCGRCREVSYCSKECEHYAWDSQHEPFCNGWVQAQAT